MPFWNTFSVSRANRANLTITFAPATEYEDVTLTTAATTPAPPAYPGITGAVPSPSLPSYGEIVFNIPSSTRIVSSTPGSTTTGSAIEVGTFTTDQDIIINNNGCVVGAGGNGGAGGPTNATLGPEGAGPNPQPIPGFPAASPGSAGQAGTPAFYYTGSHGNITINQNGTWGGGGGGGGGSGGTKAVSSVEDPETNEWTNSATALAGGLGGSAGAGGNPKTGGAGTGGTGAPTQHPGNNRSWSPTSLPVTSTLASPPNIARGGPASHPNPSITSGGAGGWLGSAGSSGAPVGAPGNRNGSPASGGAAGGRTKGPSPAQPKLTFNSNTPRTYGSDLN